VHQAHLEVLKQLSPKFDWLGDYSKVLKGKLIDYKGKTKAQIAAEALKSV